MTTSVKEYIDSFIGEINDEIQWKHLKSSRELKKTINDIVFQIDFYSSKYNDLNANIEIRCECHIWCKAYEKKNNVNSALFLIPILEDFEYWRDITNNNRDKIKAEIISEIKEKIVPLATALETDYNGGIQALADIPQFSRFTNSLKLFDERLGREKAASVAQAYVKLFSELDKKLAVQYINGENKLINEHNLRYLIDNNLAEISRG